MSKRKLFVTAGAALLVVGSIAWNAEATTLSGTAGLQPTVKNFSPVELAACWCGPYRCACGHARYYGYYGHPRYYGYYGRRCWWRRGVRVCA